MKILVCIPCLLTGGTEIQTLSLVEALVAAGHDVVVACYFEHASQMVGRYRAAGAAVELMSADGSRPAGVRRTLAHLWRGLRRIVRTHRPQAAHVQYMAPGALPVLVLRALGVKKIIATSHTMADIYPSLKQIHWLNRNLLTAFQCITRVAEESFFGSSALFDADTVLSGRNNHFTIYNNLPPYISVCGSPRVGAPLTVGVISRLEEIKGMDLVVPAFAKVHARYPDTRLLVVGDGRLRRLMEEQVRSHSIPAGVVEFTGRRPQDSLQACYDAIDILLMPSRSEGFGLTAIEGMARGCVPVVARVGGLPEVVTAGTAGLLHEPGNIDAMADAMCGLLSSPERFRALSAGAVRRAEVFSAARYRALIAALYQKLQ